MTGISQNPTRRIRRWMPCWSYAARSGTTRVDTGRRIPNMKTIHPSQKTPQKTCTVVTTE